MLKKIERESLWDLAYAQLRDALLAGRFEPGSVLTLRHLADTFGTSITPVRDVVMRLVAQGVLEQGPRNSAVVPNVGVTALQHLIVVRSELEGRAAREAAAHQNARHIASLEKKMATMRDLIARGKVDDYLDVHRRFHFEIYEMAGIPILLEMIENLWLRCGPVLSFVVPEYVVSLKGTDHHIATLDALKRGDGNAVEAEIVADIQEAASYLTSLADESGRILRPARAGVPSTPG